MLACGLKEKSIDWGARQTELLDLLNKNRKNNGDFDCFVPCSSGKDRSYVTYNLKHK